MEEYIVDDTAFVQMPFSIKQGKYYLKVHEKHAVALQ